jgi:hypothetical protein
MLAICFLAACALALSTANFALLLGILFSDLHFHLVLAIDSNVNIQYWQSGL